MLRSIFSLIIFCLGPQVAHTLERPFSNNVFVVTRDASRASVIAATLPPGMKLVARYDNFLIVATKDLNEAYINRLKKMNGVSRVQRSFRARYLSPLAERCSYTPETLPSSKLTKEFECMALLKCGRGERSRLWAQKFLGTDLAQSYLKSKGVPRTSAIAVVDSGFDFSLMEKIDSSHNLKVYSAISERPIEPDISGHGSRVVSMIKGHQGIGGSVASPVSVYGLGKSEKIDMAEVGIGILRACEEGHDIINISIGADLGPLKTTLSDLVPEEAMERIKKRGCILIHSSGNEGAPIETGTGAEIEFDIGSTNADGKISSFSSRSQFLSPGEDVVGLQVPNSGSADRALECNAESGSQQSLSSGTSFAAPLFTTVVASVRDVLLQSEVFRSLGKFEQASRIRQILKASEVDSIPNAFLAVQIADEWNRKPKESVQSAARRFHDSATKSCASIRSPECTGTTCSELDKCEYQTRSHALLCGSQDPKAISSLIQLLQKRGDLENTSYWMRRYSKLFPQQRLEIKFPLERMASDLNGNPTQSMTLRWLKYFNSWKAISSGDESGARALLLKQESVRAINQISDLDGREKSGSAFRETSSLFVEMRKLSPGQLPNTLDWAETMWKDPSKNEFVIATLLRAQNEGVVTGVEVQSVADKLLAKADLDPKNITYASILLKGSTLPDSQKVAYATKLLANQNLSEENIEKAVDLASVKDPTVYLSAIEAAAKRQNLGPRSSFYIAMRIIFLMDELPTDQKNRAIAIAKELGTRPDIGDWAKAAIEMTLNPKK